MQHPSTQPQGPTSKPVSKTGKVFDVLGSGAEWTGEVVGGTVHAGVRFTRAALIKVLGGHV